MKLELIKYGPEFSSRFASENLEEIIKNIENDKVNWINVSSLEDKEIIAAICDRFDLHPLLLGDILNTEHLPKVEEYDKYIFFTLKMLKHKGSISRVVKEHVSFVIGNNFLISFQEEEGDVFNPIRERIITGKGRVRQHKADYLCYLLVDIIVNNYHLILDKIGDRIEYLEERVLDGKSENVEHLVIELKKKLIGLKKVIYPLRDALSRLIKGNSLLIEERTVFFFSDVYDHTIHLVSDIEAFRDMVSGLIEFQMTNISNKMNSVMKILTIIATIFIPLTFICGIYGMNFKFMPELNWRWSYPIVLAVMLILALLMLMWMKKRHWF
ncbi:MAG: magnesium/cobalt transporter CorA [Candidatus Cloacimonetes bacterium]|nr:magnesium/cobalt transporter CorA [Candidatus Cloacimonadota bacterium]